MRFRDSIAHAVRKAFSGRWLMTLSACIVFVHGALTGVIGADHAVPVVTMIAGFYFGQRTAEKGNVE